MPKKKVIAVIKKSIGKSQVQVFFNKWLDLMEKAWEELTFDQFRELEDKIKKEIESYRREYRGK